MGGEKDSGEREGLRRKRRKQREEEKRGEEGKMGREENEGEEKRGEAGLAENFRGRAAGVKARALLSHSKG
jgi:hypothetical protein